MNREMQIILEVNREAEDFYEDAVRLGDHAAHALTGRHRAQITGLENIADSALKTSDVLDYIKRQTARFSYWRQNFMGRSSQGGPAYPWNDLPFGERLKLYVEKALAVKRDEICERLKISGNTDEERHLRRRIYLLLIRQFVHQVAIQYEYRVALANDRKGA